MIGLKADLAITPLKAGLWTNSDVAAYPNSDRRALIIPKALTTAESMAGSRVRRVEGARLKEIGLFEMRRLEALSNTIFGVAMTLLAYDLPKASRFANAPAWKDLVNAYAQPVIALTISFVVAGVFWLSHHRRHSPSRRKAAAAKSSSI